MTTTETARCVCGHPAARHALDPRSPGCFHETVRPTSPPTVDSYCRCPAYRPTTKETS